MRDVHAGFATLRLQTVPESFTISKETRPVPICSRAEDFYCNRGEKEICLNRLMGSTAVLRRLSCAIPGANGMIQVAYIYLL